MSNSRWPKPNHNYVPEYQISSIPYVTSSHVMANQEVAHIEFPTVSRWIVVHAKDEHKKISIGFTDNGVKGVETDNFYTLHGGEITPRLELKTKEDFIKADEANAAFCLIAGLTSVEASSFPTLTGSLVDERGNKILEGVG